MALPFLNPLAAFAILIFGGGTVADNEPSVTPNTECVGVACMRDHTQHARPSLGRPDHPGDEPGDDESDDESDDKPGHGHGDKNHHHNGPPGHGE